MRKIILLFSLLFLAQPLFAEPRTALIIGNGGYYNTDLKLPNPVNDARAMASTLRELGFEVIHLEDVSQIVMEDAVQSLGYQLSTKGGVGLFYYAGHGAQVGGRNYLIPVDFVMPQPGADPTPKAMNAELVLENMEKANNDMNIVIMDACRNNPFTQSVRSMGAKRGLAAMQAPKGSLIAFATSPGSTAADGDGDNGVYTSHLLKYIRTPGLSVERMFKQVRSGVIQETQNRQIPWESTSIQGEFFFSDTADSDSDSSLDITPTPQAAYSPTPKVSSEESISRSSGGASSQVEFAMFRENGKNPPTLVTSGNTLKSGDAYFFHIKPQKECYLYLFQVDSSKAIFRLFPNNKYHTGDNPMRAKMRHTLPNEREVFYLDQTKGKEEFYFLVSQSPVEKLENLEEGSVNDIMNSGLSLRGPGGVKAATSTILTENTGPTTAQVQEFSFTKSFVHAMTINHN